ncbi:MAG: hypothetical protein KGZ30_01660 [Anaplasmataceae bacterium]|nr:hypothetical protein [Anaplasmataceae bacterium]
MQNTSRVLLWIVLIFGIIVLVALWGGKFAETGEMPTNNENQEEQEEMVSEDNSATIAAKNQLLGELSKKDVVADPSQIEVVTVEATDWPNGCLGLEKEGEVCTQVIVPGFKVVLKFDGTDYTFRTDTEGTIVIEETKTE